MPPEPEPEKGLTTKDLSTASAGFKTTLFGLGSVVVTGIMAKVSEICPDLLSQWPALLTAGGMAALGFWLRSPKNK